MKKTFSLLLIAALILGFTGCGVQTPQPSPTSGALTLPEEFSPPGTMEVDELLSMVTELIGYNEAGEKELTLPKEDAESFTVPLSADEEQRLYIFTVEDLEIALFADLESDCLMSMYVRSLFDDAVVEAYMASYAGAFLSLLEPKEYSNMLNAVLPDEAGTVQSEQSSGEAWTIFYSVDIVKILPNELTQ